MLTILFSTIVYLKCGPNADQFLVAQETQIFIRVPRIEKNTRRSASVKTKQNGDGGWIERKRPRKSYNNGFPLFHKKSPPTVAFPSTSSTEETENDRTDIIDICDSSEGEAEKGIVIERSHDLLEDSDDEFEFEA